MTEMRVAPSRFTSTAARVLEYTLPRSRKLTIAAANTAGLIMTAPGIRSIVKGVLGRDYDLGGARRLYLENAPINHQESGLKALRNITTLNCWPDYRMGRVSGIYSFKQRFQAFIGESDLMSRNLLTTTRPARAASRFSYLDGIRSIPVGVLADPGPIYVEGPESLLLDLSKAIRNADQKKPPETPQEN